MGQYTLGKALGFLSSEEGCLEEQVVLFSRHEGNSLWGSWALPGICLLTVSWVKSLHTEV